MIEKFQNKYGIKVLHAWGMTEMSPLGTICSFKPEVLELSDEDKLNVQETTGHPPFSVDLKITNDHGESLPWDGMSPGKLWARGAAVVKRYLKSSSDIVDSEGWFDTGDVATIDRNGYMRITDRSKDVIKSGGEWISSIDLENAAVGHPDIIEAACIGVDDEKTGEAVKLFVVKSNPSLSIDEVMDYCKDNFTGYKVPKHIEFIDELPKSNVGKVLRRSLRE